MRNLVVAFRRRGGPLLVVLGSRRRGGVTDRGTDRRARRGGGARRRGVVREVGPVLRLRPSDLSAVFCRSMIQSATCEYDEVQRRRQARRGRTLLVSFSLWALRRPREGDSWSLPGVLCVL